MRLLTKLQDEKVGDAYRIVAVVYKNENNGYKAY